MGRHIPPLHTVVSLLLDDLVKRSYCKTTAFMRCSSNFLHFSKKGKDLKARSLYCPRFDMLSIAGLIFIFSHNAAILNLISIIIPVRRNTASRNLSWCKCWSGWRAAVHIYIIWPRRALSHQERKKEIRTWNSWWKLGSNELIEILCTAGKNRHFHIRPKDKW